MRAAKVDRALCISITLEDFEDVHAIVRAHGGRLWHTPNEECGARFHFTLPVSPAKTGE